MRARPAAWKPSEEQMRLWPKTSGNAINGLGEERKRRASPIYWHAPDTIPHGPLQKWFYTQTKSDLVNEARKQRQIAIDAPLAPLAETRAHTDRRRMDARGRASCERARRRCRRCCSDARRMGLRKRERAARKMDHRDRRRSRLRRDPHRTRRTRRRRSVAPIWSRHSRRKRDRQRIAIERLGCVRARRTDGGRPRLDPRRDRSGDWASSESTARSFIASSARAFVSRASSPTFRSCPASATISAPTHFARAARSAATPARRSRFMRKNSWFVASAVGTSTSTNAFRISTSTWAARSASRCVRSVAPKSVRASWRSWRAELRASVQGELKSKR